jgi:hypothetical protein
MTIPLLVLDQLVPINEIYADLKQQDAERS